MPHYTRQGDDGTTTLFGGGRVPKHHPQPETLGAIDEASSALGLARALAAAPKTNAFVKELQQRLYLIMAELAVTEGKDVPQEFVTTAAATERLEAIAAELEDAVPPPAAFVIPGETPAAGAFDLARTVVRRAERQVSRLRDSGHAVDPAILRYLNRASSVLYDLARYEEHHAGQAAPRATRQGTVDG
ncbi:MAG: cob(I)yrinic acid a,c-diamide adenosyltransferase [Chloroflexi bacterium]|nr:cob(I)yrinic acid a,c-diamide adenosyltransferase [Chloroflexota bacterium]